MAPKTKAKAKARTPGSTVVYDCGFKTGPGSWRRRPFIPADRADARTRAVYDVIAFFERERVAGRIENMGFWPRVRREAAVRVPLSGPVPAPPGAAGSVPRDAGEAPAP